MPETTKKAKYNLLTLAQATKWLG